MTDQPTNARYKPHTISTTAKTQAITSVIFASCRRCILTISNPQKIMGPLTAAFAAVGGSVPNERSARHG